MWDTSGQQRFRELAATLYKGVEGFVMVYDITQPSSFDAALKIRNELITLIGIKEPERFPTMIVGNKSDLHRDRRIQQDMVTQQCRLMGTAQHVDVSAMKNEGVHAAFQSIAKMIMLQVNFNPDWNYFK